MRHRIDKNTCLAIHEDNIVLTQKLMLDEISEVTFSTKGFRSIVNQLAYMLTKNIERNTLSDTLFGKIYDHIYEVEKHKGKEYFDVNRNETVLVDFDKSYAKISQRASYNSEWISVYLPLKNLDSIENILQSL